MEENIYLWERGRIDTYRELMLKRLAGVVSFQKHDRHRASARLPFLVHHVRGSSSPPLFPNTIPRGHRQSAHSARCPASSSKECVIRSRVLSASPSPERAALRLSSRITASTCPNWLQTQFARFALACNAPVNWWR
jgi:hypothetical protein